MHGVPALAAGVESVVAPSSSNGLIQNLVSTLLGALVGIVAGGVVVAIVIPCRKRCELIETDEMH